MKIGAKRYYQCMSATGLHEALVSQSFLFLKFQCSAVLLSSYSHPWQRIMTRSMASQNASWTKVDCHIRSICGLESLLYTQESKALWEIGEIVRRPGETSLYSQLFSRLFTASRQVCAPGMT